ncbi:adenylate kinase [Thermoanaerobaculum aquaticum]|uniref:adenylate kinase n=1 Tax=Thermoanaerobaculum aquaticum TaxID=1312852 RepID=UPI000A5F9ED2|nr:adenylate kinase [Thermoanaerobaculum aquaticum]
MVTRALDVVLLGPPGAGKGTQAKRLAATFNLLHISTGDLLREEVGKGSELGQQAASYMQKGELVPDDLVAKMLVTRLHSQQGLAGCVFDGYPRTRAQAELLDGLLAELGRRVDVAVYLEVPDDEVVARLGGRRSCPSCGAVYHLRTQPPARDGVCDVCGSQLVVREDDKEEVIRQRLAVYRTHTEPLLELYGGRGVLARVPGQGTPEEVFLRLADAVRGGRER